MQKELLIDCIGNLQTVLQYTTSGSDVHAAANLRCCAQMLTEALEQGIIDEEKAEEIYLRLKEGVTDFFKNKYWG